MTNAELIEEILHEAASYGLRTEVINCAKRIKEQNSAINAVTSYELAFKQCIKWQTG